MRHIITPPLQLNCDIALMGDTHIGTVFCNEPAIDQAIDWVASKPNRYFCFMGDAIEAITPDDKRFQADAVSEPFPERQAKYVIKKFWPIRKKGLVWLLGNHEERLKHIANYAQYIADGLGIPYGTWTAKVLVRGKHRSYFKMFLKHSIRSTLNSMAKDYDQRLANMKATLKMQLREHAGDCMLMAVGHAHRILVADPIRKMVLMSDEEHKELRNQYLVPHEWGEEYIDHDLRWYGVTGSFLKQYVEGLDGYAERAGYDPLEIGYLVAEVRGGKLRNVRPVVL